MAGEKDKKKPKKGLQPYKPVKSIFEMVQERRKVGCPRIFNSPDELYDAACGYFQWITENPLKEEKVFSNGVKEVVNKMRPFTLMGLELYLGICGSTWANYRSRQEFLGVVTEIEKIIYSQKFEGAAADLLNPNIIARDLGLTDKKDITSKGESIAEKGTKITLPNGTELDLG